MRLQGKVALVTGSTRGIGKAIAKRFAAEGASVIVTGRGEENGRAVEQEIRDAGGEATYVRMDLGVESDVQGAVAFAVERYGKLTTLVNNAGPTDLVSSGVDGPLMEMTTDRWEQMFRFELTGPFWATKHAMLEMKKGGGGSIVNVTGTHGHEASTGLVCLATFKGGVDSLSLVAAAEGAPYGIRSNCIAPGLCVGENAATQAIGSNPQLTALYLRGQLVQRLANMDDIANAALWLASDESAMVTAHFLPVDGGLIMKTGHPDFHSDEFKAAFAACS